VSAQQLVDLDRASHPQVVTASTGGMICVSKFRGGDAAWRGCNKRETARMRRAGRGTVAGGVSVGEASDGRFGRAAPVSQPRSDRSRGAASFNQTRHVRRIGVAPLTRDPAASANDDGEGVKPHVEVGKLHVGIGKLHVGIVAMQRAPSVRRR